MYANHKTFSLYTTFPVLLQIHVLFSYNPLSQISTLHRYMSGGQSMKQQNPTSGHNPWECWVFLPQQP